MRIERLMTLLCVFRAFGKPNALDVCFEIIARSAGPVSRGKSSYARKRRAVSIGRCWRCYRVYPPICGSKCNNKTCVPGISPNMKVVNFIHCGVTEVIPHPGFNF
uniref:RNA silencing suppressor n=1 Tax=Potato virus S TaxID=12169 RepID=A0A2P1E976_9VIRU|nr:putative nucleic acid binding protein [Potato virus S]